MANQSPTDTKNMSESDRIHKLEEELATSKKKIVELEAEISNMKKSPPHQPQNPPQSNKFCIRNKNMDELNQKAADVWNTQGPEAAVKHMFTDAETGRELSYAEMRYRYG